MLISEKQIIQLMTVLYDSVRAKIVIDGMFALSADDRVALYNQILSQQSEIPKVIE
jgi:hypothetical protein